MSSQHQQEARRSSMHKGKLWLFNSSGQHHKKSNQQPQISPVLSSASITNRVYILGLEDSKRITIKEVMYVDVSRSVNHRGNKSAGRPHWVPDYIQQDSWCLDPPSFWKTESVAMQDLETNGGKLLYNPLADYSLELIRWHRPDLFDSLYHLFCVWNRRVYSGRQLDQIKDLIKPESVTVADFDAHFEPGSPVAATLQRATLTDNFLPEIEHYLALLSLRAFRLRNIMLHIK